MKINDFFKLATSKGIKKIQITEVTNENTDAEIINGELIENNFEKTISYNIKAEYLDKTINVTSDYLDEEIIDLLIFKAEVTESKYEDKYLEDKTNNNNVDSLVNLTIKDEIEKIIELDKLRKEYKYISKISSYINSSYEKIRIYNNNGVDMASDKFISNIYISALANNESELTNYDKQVINKDIKSIDIEKLTKEVLTNAEILLKKKKLDTKKYDIILTPHTAGRIIYKFAAMLEASNIRLNKSCLCNKLNEKLLSSKINIIEDPSNNEYPGFRLFDDEGTKTYKKIIVKDGVFKTYLYNNKEALLKNIKSTGNRYLNTCVKNMYLVNGNKSYDDLVKKLNNGIIITEFMGSSNSALDIINGTISIQIFGFIVENGKIISGFVPSIMTTDFFELFSNVKEIGNDLEFENTSCASPSILIEDISIASN